MSAPERAAALAALLLLTGPGCGRRDERVLRVMLRSPVVTFDPRATEDTITLRVLSNVYDSLVQFDAELRVVPALAASWTNPAEDVWRFELRRDVRFHDGSPLSAHDVKQTLDRGLAPPRPWLGNLAPLIRGARVVGEHSIEIETNGPAPLLLNRLAALPILAFRAGESPLGSGPFRPLGARPSSEEVRLRGVGGHWSGAPRWDEVVLRAEPRGAERTAAVLDGRADLAEWPRREDEAAIAASPRARVIEFPDLTLQILGFRVLAEPGNPFADPEVRRAISLAIDREALVREAFSGHARPAFQLAPEGVFGFVRDLPREVPDLAASRAALAGSGFARGFRQPLFFTERDKDVAGFVVRALAPLGIALEPREVLWPELDRLMGARQAPAYLFQLGFPNCDTHDVLLDGLHTRDASGSFGVLNFSGHSDPELDRLVAAAGAELQTGRRFALLERAMRLAVPARAWLGLCVPTSQYAARAALRWRGHPTGRLRFQEIEAE